ncbi:MAG TPA: hypothetical protein VFX17_03570 [Patescibacteria group bacterium]|nr:hypothetical protein [Patescibacteria group bacterium]
MWQQFVNGSLGVASIFALYPYASSETGHVLVVVFGVLVAIFGYWGGAVARRHRNQIIK